MVVDTRIGHKVSLLFIYFCFLYFQLEKEHFRFNCSAIPVLFANSHHS